jgi:hypothetical protein
MRGLAAGRSFVTTGPMLLAKVDEQWPGTTFQAQQRSKNYRLECTALSEQPLESLELIVNGVVSKRFDPQNKKSDAGSYESRVTTDFNPPASSWLVWRCFEKRPGNRQRFAHTGPWHFEVAGRPLRPPREQCEWLVARVKEEIARNADVAPKTLLDDYQRALQIYEQLANTAE